MLLGITERLEVVDTPGHVDDMKRDRPRGYVMKGYRIRLVMVEVRSPSANSVNMAGMTMEDYPPRPLRTT